jgi:predicted nucleotidyltransferase
MVRLSILEDLKRRNVELSEVQRKSIEDLLREILSKHKEVSLALLFGGILVPGKPVRDIDVAVYTDYRVPYERWPVYADELRVELENALEKSLGLLKYVDVIILEYAPPKFRVEVLSHGKVIVERVPGLRTILLLHEREELEKFVGRRRVLG